MGSDCYSSLSLEIFLGLIDVLVGWAIDDLEIYLLVFAVFDIGGDDDLEEEICIVRCELDKSVCLWDNASSN
jgi:hypothetical protein